jgi:hypothetical protein
MSTLTAKIQLRRDTSANWTSNNPILAAGEVAFTSDVFYTGTDQQRFKIGDGVQTWTQLDYVPEGGAGYPENLFLTVVNKTGDNLLASGYKVMKVSAAQGQRLAVDYALADSNGNSTDTIGIVYENIDNNQSGKLITVGEITGLNTTGTLQGQTWEDGDVLYLDSTTAGNLTNIQATAPNHLVVMGYVVYAHPNQGKIYCRISNGWEIGELHDVYAPTPTHNEGIFWSSGTTRYENKSITTALGYTAENTSNKSIDGTLNANSDTLYPSQKAIKTYVDGSVTGLLDDRGNYNASGNVFPSSGGSGTAGAILKGDLWYISVAGTLGGTSVVVGSSVRALVDTPNQTSANWSILNVGLGYTPENSSNKATSFSTVNNTLYPSVQAVKTYFDTFSAVGNNAIIYSGQYKLNGFYGSKSSSINWNSFIYLQPYFIGINHIITEIGCEVVTGVGGSNIRLAIYSDLNGEPNNLIEESAAINSNSSGFKSHVLATPYSLTIGMKVVWLAIQVSSASISLRTGQVFNFIGKTTTGIGGDNRSKVSGFGSFSNPIGATTSVNSSVAMWVKVQ